LSKKKKHLNNKNQFKEKVDGSVLSPTRHYKIIGLKEQKLSNSNPTKHVKKA
jgi:hypothetical protein